MESSDGITWHKPELGLVDFRGSTANNLVIDDPDLVNFSPFLDPEAPAQERYKGYRPARCHLHGGLARRPALAQEP